MEKPSLADCRDIFGSTFKLIDSCKNQCPVGAPGPPGPPGEPCPTVKIVLFIFACYDQSFFLLRRIKKLGLKF